MIRGGYGQLNDRGRLLKAHRLSYEIHCGSIPSGLLICHRCNVPACCNPKHLYACASIENTRDKIIAGTQFKIPTKRGEESPSAKLTAKQVDLVRRSTDSHASLGRRFGVTKQAIFRIRKGLSWIR